MIKKRIFSCFLSFSIFIGLAGCGEVSSVSETVSASESVPVESVVSVIEEPETVEEEKEVIWDFDEYINEEWKSEQRKKDETTVYAWDEHRQTVKQRLVDILENEDISTLSEDDGLYKAIVMYRQFLNAPDEKEKSIESVKKYLSKIDKVKSLNDLYDLYKDESYAVNNFVLKFEVNPDDYGYNALWFVPNSLSGSLNETIEAINGKDPKKDGESFLGFMEELGYSKEKSLEVLSNAAKAGELIDAYWNNPKIDGYTYYYDAEKLEKENVTVPVFDILSSLNAIGASEDFLAEKGCCDFLNSMFTEENVPLLRDHLLVKSVFLFSWISSFSKETEEEKDLRPAALSFLTLNAGDVLTKEYIKRYIDESVLTETDEYLKEIKQAAIDTVYDANWLSTHGKELARRKILRMRDVIAVNEDTDDLSDIEISDDTIENYLAFTVNRERFFRTQTTKEDEGRQVYKADMLDVNGRFYPEYDAVMITAGLISYYADQGDMSYEEKLGFLGRTLAHEISHCYDPSNMAYDGDGYYEPWLTDDEQAAYDEETEKLRAFLSGKKDEYGNEINVNVVMNETYADILGLKICLRLLSEKEDADYETFFRTYAKQNASYYSKDDAEAILKDSHLPNKLRVNLVCGQFDEFYETFDISERSEYYIPEEERIDLFAK